MNKVTALRKQRKVEGRGRRKRDALLYSEYFTESELKALCNYKNAGCDLSLTYKYMMSPLYDRLVNFLPMWLAPNMVTLLGFLAVFTSHLLLAFYAPNLSEEAPRWTYLLNFLGLFTYMVLDNLDGRQARRTGSSSPLGHLFDHSCDGINVLVTGLSVATTLRLGNSVWTFLLVYFFGMIVFMTSTIEEFYTGKLVLREINGANEGLILMQAFYLMAALFGTEIWITPVQLFRDFTLPLGKCVLFLIVPVALPTLYTSYRAIYKMTSASSPSPFVQSLKGSVPFWFSSVCMFIWILNSNVMERYPFLFMWTCELTFLYIVSYVIVGHLCGRSKLPTMSYMTLPLAFGMVNALFTKYLGDGLLELPLLFNVLIITLIVNLRNAYRISKQICDHLDISMLRISKKVC